MVGHVPGARLSALRPGQRAVVKKVRGPDRFRKRLLEMGFVPGTPVAIEKFAPLGDPAEYVIKGAHVSLRRTEADSIEVDGVAEGTP